jgi:hypothetical protein
MTMLDLDPDLFRALTPPGGRHPEAVHPRRGPRIVAIGGSTRPGSSAELALRVAAAAAEDAGAELTFITGRELMLPIYDTESDHRTPDAM